MRVFHIRGDQFTELGQLPADPPEGGYLWLAFGRREFELHYMDVQLGLQRWNCGALVDLHVADLINNQLPSHFDYTSWYDMLIFRRLAAAPGSEDLFVDDQHGTLASAQKALRAIDTSPVGFAVFDRVLLSVHPTDCAVRDYFAQKLGALTEGRDLRGASRLPNSSAELMLRMVNHMVDSYLDLRRLLTRQMQTVQHALMDSQREFHEWPLLLESRDALHRLEDTCEDQRSAMQEWIDVLDDWPASQDAAVLRDRELLRVRSRDVLEHIERVLTHVRRMESSSESAVQMHFSALGHRTNNIMRTLTVLTAIFLPLNLITGIFGMNFDTLPLIHRATGVWIALGVMVMIALLLGSFFWRKRYLGTRR
ncbi:MULTISPECIES: magnesium transporter CorA family protein [Roseateles]|uniref:Magnesium transporter CorA family protein n=1 Tax=Roseateles albus TaxID=2987525 RepID=A0ABT5KKZ0_9BURK|nr:MULTISPECIES: magnesium transporter CorA family protein [Roseateles]MCV2360121.1 magnesium transporter CorA family protein [Paucibacter sp. TC2R-5]MDC8774531.1 magnesium transporter CorA family protein [Roseateles albus]